MLVGTSAGLFLLMLDSTVVSLSLPSIQQDLNASSDQLQWIINAYLLVLAVLVITAGRFGDIFGRKRVFLSGFFIFGIGSIVAAAAWTADVLVLARVIMAAGGAAMLPLSLALVTYVFPKEEQAKAIGIWTAVSAIALGVGPLVGGVLVEFDWRLIFLINLPIAAFGVVVTGRAAQEIRDESSKQTIDWPGLILITVSMTAIVWALINADDAGWGSIQTLGLLIGGTALMVIFWIVEHRVKNPLVEFALFRNRPYLGATAAAFGVVAMYWTLIFYEPQYLQNILDYSPIEAGILVLPITVPMIVISPFSGRIMAVAGAKVTMTLGMVLGVIGLVILTQISEASGYGILFPGLLAIGLSFALVYAPMSTAAMAAMPKAKAGIASGALAMNRLLAGAVGLALVGAVFQTLQNNERESELASSSVDLNEKQKDQLDGLLAGSEEAKESIPDDPPGVQQEIFEVAADVYTFALGNATWVLVGIMAVCTVLTFWLVEPKEPTTDVPEAAETDEHKHHFRGRFHL
ncbi:MAG: MFS transporter [Solirubrobacterales bacterium]